MQKDVIEGYRLSPQQERLWLQQHANGHNSYRAQCAVLFDGPLDQKTLEAALMSLVERYEILRTSFQSLPGMSVPLQMISEAVAPLLAVSDLTDLEWSVQQPIVEGLFREAGEVPFDFQEKSLLRASLCVLAPDRHVLLLLLPALCADAATLNRLVSELVSLYARPPVPEERLPHPLQYADISEALNELLVTDETEEARVFWRKFDLHGLTPTDLSERSAFPDERFAPGLTCISLSSELIHEITTVCLEQESAPEDFLLVCWQILISRLTGDTEPLIGLATDGRTDSDFAATVGPLKKYLPLRCSVSGQMQFCEVLRQLAATRSELDQWQEAFSLDQFWRTADPEAGIAADLPFFHLCFEFDEEAADGWGKGVGFKIIHQYVCSDRFKLKLRGGRRNGSLFVELHYDSDLFSVEYIRRLAERFEMLVASAVRFPELAVARLEIVGTNERRELVHDWNQTKTEYDSGLCVHQMFEEQVARAGTLAAVRFGEQELTFDEVNGRANQLARHLQAMGVGPETRVGIMMERCTEMVIGILAILKAGGAYLPLDSTNPANRLSFMLDDAGAELILTQQHLACNSAALQQRSVLCLDTDWESISHQSTANVSSSVQPDNLAYIIYTSGSTGAPKGVMVTHRGVVNYLSWCCSAYRVADGKGAPVHSSIGFDLTVTSLFASLVVGRKVELLRSEQEIEALAESLRSHQDYSLIKITPAHLEVLSRWLSVAEVAGATRCIVIGGEALRAESLQFWRQHAPLTRLINEYGPTETVVGCCTYEVKAGDAQSGSVSIGRPIANTQLYIVDEELQIVPVGVSGELYIGGAGVGRGYIARADLTAARFVPDPFSEAGGQRLYRTGDLARYRPDGEMEYQGRLDQQVKLRGYRIELGEIEGVLALHPAVGQALVVTREYTMGDTRLVAYVVPDQEHAGGVQRLLQMERDGALQAHSLRELPNGMTIFQRHRGESDYLYREIFVEREYLRHGITLEPGACVFDVGANIGMFSLFVGSQFPGAQLYAFEPIPQTFAVLQQNVKLHGLTANLFECGVAGEAGEASFTHYPQMSLMSSRFADETADREVIIAFELNQQRKEAGARGQGWSDEVLDQVVTEHLAAERVTCRLRTISEVIREHGVERIDLLKVDVERSELEVLSGIADEDWPKIEQLVIEVHDVGGRLQELCSLLTQRDFQLSVAQEGYLEGTELHVVYARRDQSGTAPRKAEHEDAAANGEVTWSSGRQLQSDLRCFLAERLPDYMMPAAIVLLAQFPLTSNGKIDTRNLPGPTQERPGLGTALELPRTQVEEVVAGIWAEVLKLDHVGVDDNFFELGGHSLLATRVISRLREVFRLELFMRTLFEKPTVATLAKQVEAELTAGKQLPAMAITKVSRAGRLPLSYAQQRLWFVHQFNPRSSAYNVAKIIHLKGQLNFAALERTLGEVIARHEVLRTTISKVDGELIQIIHPVTNFTLEVLELTAVGDGERKAEFRRLALEEAELPFELDRGPLIRTTLVEMGDDEHALLITMHHIVCDGWTIGVFIKEVVALYRAFQKGDATPLEQLSIQYADFAVWQRQWLDGDVSMTLLDYWRRQLADLPLPLKLPTDLPRPPVQTLNGARQSLLLDKNTSAELKRLSRNEGVTLFMTFLAAFKVLLYRYSDETDIVVGTPIAGRNRAELEQLIGFFVNTLVLRTRLSADLTFRQLLVAVRETTLDSYAHQDMPFERLVEELQPERNASHSPLFQVSFALQNLPTEALEMTGLIVTFLESQRGSSKFDLSLNIESAAEGLVAAITFNTDLFRSETIARMLQDFASLLDAIITNPEERLANLLPVIRRELATPDGLDEGRLFDEIHERSDVTTEPASTEPWQAKTRVAASAWWPNKQFVAPRTTIELGLALIWENVLNVRPIGVTENFFELGGHSLLVLHVMAQVEKTFDQEISLTSFFQSPTIESLARSLSQQGNGLSCSALVPIQPHGSRTPFFCVHSLGGDVLHFYGLARHLGSDQPFYGLQAPHLTEIGERQTSVEEMATRYIEAMRSVQPKGPYYIGGYSFGSTIAFEMAQQLRKLNEEIGLLALLDGGSPLVMHKIKDRGDAITMAGFARDLARASGVALSLPHDEIRRLEPEEGLNYIVEKLRSANLVSPDVQLSWFRRFLQGVKTRTRALKSYHPEVYNGVITLFRSGESEAESAKAWLEVGVDVRDPSRGWASLSTQSLAIIHIPGHHVEMTEEPNVAVLAQLLKSSIDENAAAVR